MGGLTSGTRVCTRFMDDRRADNRALANNLSKAIKWFVDQPEYSDLLQAGRALTTTIPGHYAQPRPTSSSKLSPHRTPTAWETRVRAAPTARRSRSRACPGSSSSWVRSQHLQSAAPCSTIFWRQRGSGPFESFPCNARGVGARPTSPPPLPPLQPPPPGMRREVSAGGEALVGSGPALPAR